MQDSFEGCFSCNPNCVKHRAVRNSYHIGAGNIAKCEHPKGECAAGLQHFSTKPPKQSDHLDVQNQNTNKKETWHASVAGVHDGSVFCHSSLCGDPPGSIKKVAEWNICWGPITQDIAASRCIVYSFGIANDDPFTNFMDEAGCQVLAFDPAQQYPRDYKPNTKFYPYGLVSGMSNEQEYNHRHWGDTSAGQYKTLMDIKNELGHSGAAIPALKINCEGCEWNLFANMEDPTLSEIIQILTKIHFTTTLRFNGDLAGRYAEPFVGNLNRHFGMYHFEKNDGAWYDRFIDERVAAAGIPTFPTTVRTVADGCQIKTNTDGCCVEMSFMNRAVDQNIEQVFPN